MDKTHKELQGDINRLSGSMDDLRAEIMDKVSNLNREVGEIKTRLKPESKYLLLALLPVIAAAVKYLFFPDG